MLKAKFFATILFSFLVLEERTLAKESYPIKSLSEAQANEYKLDRAFYKKATMAQGILIATSSRVASVAHQETAYQFDMLMRNLKPDIADRIRKKKVLCLLIGHDELTSQLPQFPTNKTGDELDFYNWRQRGFLTYIGSRPTVVFAEEDVMEYEGGMQLESILVHEFGHVVHGAGFDEELQKRIESQKGIEVIFSQIKNANHFFKDKEKDLKFEIEKYIKEKTALI